MKAVAEVADESVTLGLSAPAGLQYHEVDLHVHTPASQCFADKSVTAAQIVEAALAAGLQAIAITDHNSSAFIDEVKEQALGTQLTVFPGVEITASGGQTGVHVLAIFDPSATSSQINDLLSRVRIPPDQHGQETVMGREVCEVIQEIEASKAIAILAHANSTKGVLCDMRGQNRTRVFQETGLLAVEVTDGDFSDEKRKRGTRAIDLLNGTVSNYAQRKLAVIQGSDSRQVNQEGHSLAGIGSRRTFIRAGVPLDLEGLRQAFIDPDSRIRLLPVHGDALPALPQPRIVSIGVTGGFFDGLDLHFHPGMNSIIGGKGAGKSLLIELLRFGLSAEATNVEIKKDHEGKLERRLERFGKVSITVADNTGTTKTLDRTYDPASGNRFGDESQRQIAEEFPALFLSQNEIIRIAESDEEQLGFIDRFFDFRAYRRTIEQLGDELSRLDLVMADSLRAQHELKGKLAQRDTMDKRVVGLDEQLKNDTFSRYARALKKAQSLNQLVDSSRTIVREVGDLREALEGIPLPALDVAVSDDPAVKRALASLEDTRDSAVAGLAGVLEAMNTSARLIQDEVDKYSGVLASEEGRYKKMVQEAGGDYKALSERRATLASERAKLQTQIDAVSARSGRLRGVAAERKEKLDALSGVFIAYSKERRDKCGAIQEFSAGRLTIAVEEATDSSEFARRLGEMKKGSYLRDHEIASIVKHLKPAAFVGGLVNYDIGDPQKKSRIIEQMAQAADIEFDRMRQLADHLLQSRTYEELLGLQHQVTPRDRPDIRVRVGDGAFEPLTAVSTGQKCTALLVMALAHGGAPVVIDQPEDSLDIKSIWEDMCVKLRSGKTHRQFICTTHNSSLAVASDSDCFIVLEADARVGRVVESGAIDTESVKSEIIDYLEGGITTYGVKYRKYDMGRRLHVN
jgi:ABC-type cobalamin/Fe3+-siderophores transport system ATPase subunit